MTYFDLPIHQRITAKGNALAFNFHYRITPGILKRMVKRHNMNLFTPSYPFYNIRFKTNTFDLKLNYNPHA